MIYQLLHTVQYSINAGWLYSGGEDQYIERQLRSALLPLALQNPPLPTERDPFHFIVRLSEISNDLANFATKVPLQPNLK